MGESLKILKRKLRIFLKLARPKIFLKYAKNKNIPKHDEPQDTFKNIFCILIKKMSVKFAYYKYSSKKKQKRYYYKVRSYKKKLYNSYNCHSYKKNWAKLPWGHNIGLVSLSVQKNGWCL